MDITTFKHKATVKHGDVYDYSHVPANVTHKDKITIVCPTHGKFSQNVNSHLCRSGCPKCAAEHASANRKKPTEYYTNKASDVHSGKYDYSLIPANIKATDMVEIVCPTHGVFVQRLNDHTNGRGCNKCARELTSVKNQKGYNHFIERCKDIHGNVYDYTLIDNNVKLKDSVTIICSMHGTFDQILDCHLSGSGCPKCARDNHSSKPEKEIQQLLDDNNIPYTPNDRIAIHPKELDIYIPSHKLAIEYCGLYWHSETRGKTKNYHKEKMEKCQQRGIRLLTIFEDEWIHNRPQVISKIKSILGIDDRERIYARNCELVIVDTKTKRLFFDATHIQGDGPSSINLGLTHKGVLVACMGFIEQKNQHYLNRYASSAHVVGGFSKLLKHFQKTHNWEKIISFADLRWSTGEMYKVTGWKLDTIIPPDYSYVKGNKRVHKFNYRRKHLQRLLSNFDPKLSERINCDNNGILRIWDCGKMRFVVNNSKTKQE